MKYLVVLLFLLSVVYSQPSNDTVLPAIFYNGVKVNGTFDITRIGTTFDETLNCYTDLDTCCTIIEGFHKGHWLYPDGEEVNFGYSPGAFYHSRYEKVVRLARRGENAVEGMYCCDVETVKEHRQAIADPFVGEQVCIRLLNFTKECPALDNPANGQVMVYGYSHGNKATYSCDLGYGVVGDPVRTCYAGRWTGRAPTCEEAPGLYVVVFTGSDSDGRSSQYFNVSITFTNMDPVSLPFHDRIGGDMSKGDMWMFKGENGLRPFNKDQVAEIAIVPNGDQSWHIHSVLTLVSTDENSIIKFSLLTADMLVNRTIGMHEENYGLVLTPYVFPDKIINGCPPIPAPTPPPIPPIVPLFKFRPGI